MGKMRHEDQRLFVTGASGQLGAFVIEALARTVEPSRLVAGVRSLDCEAVGLLRQRGIEVRVADYDRFDTLFAAFEGIDRLLLISSNAIGRRVAQHRNVIEAAVAAGVLFLAYTSVLRADRSGLSVAAEHLETERAIFASGLPSAILRNGWYTEMHATGIASALASGVLIGSAGGGRISGAARADYAEAAAAVLSDHSMLSRTYELAGDDAFTLDEFADAISAVSDRPVRYEDLPESEYARKLRMVGFPEDIADLIANADASASMGALEDGSARLSKLIGRRTTPYRETVLEYVKRSSAQFEN